MVPSNPRRQHPTHRHVFLHVKDDFGSASEVLGFVEGFDGEGTSGGGFPFVEVIVVVLGLHADAVSDQVGGVEAHTELTDHRNVSASLKGTGGEGRDKILPFAQTRT